MKFKIAGREIGKNRDPLIIAEIGINHNGSYKIANKVCDFLCKIYLHQLANRCERQIKIVNKKFKG